MMTSGFQLRPLAAAMDKLLNRTRAWVNLNPVPNDIPEPEKETCKWILENSKYQTWMADGSPTPLWIHGIPGLHLICKVSCPKIKANIISKVVGSL